MNKVNGRKVVATLLEVYERCIKGGKDRLADIEVGSTKWWLYTKDIVAFDGMRQGVKELAYGLGIIDDKEFCLDMPDLMEKLLEDKKED